MFHRKAGLAVVLAVAFAAPAANAAAPASLAGHASGPAARVACTKAVIAGRHTCLAAGQRCTRSYDRQYRRYGFTCSKRDSAGRYRLVKRSMSF
jgi:hypothetical protein